MPLTWLNQTINSAALPLKSTVRGSLAADSLKVGHALFQMSSTPLRQASLVRYRDVNQDADTCIGLHMFGNA